MNKILPPLEVYAGILILGLFPGMLFLALPFPNCMLPRLPGILFLGPPLTPSTFAFPPAPKLERTLPPPSPPTKLLLDPAVESAVVGPALLAANLATTVVRDILGLRPDRLRFNVPFEDNDGTVKG